MPARHTLDRGTPRVASAAGTPLVRSVRLHWDLDLSGSPDVVAHCDYGPRRALRWKTQRSEGAARLPSRAATESPRPYLRRARGARIKDPMAACPAGALPARWPRWGSACMTTRLAELARSHAEVSASFGSFDRQRRRTVPGSRQGSDSGNLRHAPGGRPHPLKLGWAGSRPLVRLQPAAHGAPKAAHQVRPASVCARAITSPAQLHRPAPRAAPSQTRISRIRPLTRSRLSQERCRVGMLRRPHSACGKPTQSKHQIHEHKTHHRLPRRSHPRFEGLSDTRPQALARRQAANASLPILEPRGRAVDRLR